MDELEGPCANTSGQNSSLEICQHEGDVSFDNMPGQMDPYFANPAVSLPMIPVRDPFGNTLSDPHVHLASLNPSLFTSLNDGTEDIHSYVYRCLLHIVRDEPSIRQVVAEYFATVNTWFTIVDQAAFKDGLETMLSAHSAEVGLLVLCMLLVTRSPQHNHGATMQDGLYLSVKTIVSLVEARLPYSKHLLRANLLVAMYEHGHSMPQQAYTTLGTCVRMTKAFGWHQQSFWSEDRRIAAPGEVRICAVLWWATVFTDWFVWPPSIPDHRPSGDAAPRKQCVPFRKLT